MDFSKTKSKTYYFDEKKYVRKYSFLSVLFLLKEEKETQARLFSLQHFEENNYLNTSVLKSRNNLQNFFLFSWETLFFLVYSSLFTVVPRWRSEIDGGFDPKGQSLLRNQVKLRDKEWEKRT